MRNLMLLSVVALYTAACASSTPRPVTQPQAAKPAAVSAAGATRTAAQIDADEFRRELEHAYDHILARSSNEPAADTPIVDIEAAASIPIPEHRTINSAVRLFSVDMKNSIQTSLLRSAKYKPLIDKALDEHKLPRGLAYLPVIESAYTETLTSRAGAHGLWQFMPSTAREYGLRVDWWVDERADPERSTKAAAAYLRDLYSMFGDWSLALAAYNCGPGRVKRTLEATGASTFWELLDQQALPKETRGYVPTFYAALLIASDPQTYGFRLGRESERDEATVTVRGPVSLDYVAEVIGLDAETLQAMNPALRRGVIPPGRATVRVPEKKAEILAAQASRLHEGDAYMKYCSFQLRKGDSVSRLARKLGTKPETILAMNGADSTSDLQAGDTIYLPVRARELGALLAHSEDKELFHAVKKGDTLFSIAKRNGMSVSDLRELNELPKDATLRIGQKLRISSNRTMTAGGM